MNAPVAGAATGSLASTERDPNFAWSAPNITAGAPPVILSAPRPKRARTIRARFALSCTGPDCPRIRGHATGRRRIVALLARLAGQRFAAGDVVRITVTAPGLRRERIQLRIRRRRVPLARLLKG